LPVGREWIIDEIEERRAWGMVGADAAFGEGDGGFERAVVAGVSAVREAGWWGHVVGIIVWAEEL
jgi:hypothetical protein